MDQRSTASFRILLYEFNRDGDRTDKIVTKRRSLAVQRILDHHFSCQRFFHNPKRQRGILLRSSQSEIHFVARGGQYENTERSS